MRPSPCNHIPTVVSAIRQLEPLSILDVGVGFGKWGHLFREYTDIINSDSDPKRYQRANWRVTIDGIEGVGERLTSAHAYFYNNIFVGDMREKIREVGRYDVIFLGDVIESVNKADGYKLLADCLAHANKAVILTTPTAPSQQPPNHDNGSQHHRSSWMARDFHRFPLHATALLDGNTLVVVLGKPGVAVPDIRPPVSSNQNNQAPTLIAHLKRPLRPLKPLLSRLGLIEPSPSAPPPPKFCDSGTYWEERYRTGGNSGTGSYGHLAEYKARFINAILAAHDIRTVIEFGCGDGNQLSLLNVPRYWGVDVSRTAIDLLKQRHGQDAAKTFLCTLDPGYAPVRCDLAMSLDVIFHLVEDAVFERYMNDLFNSAARLVVIYSSNVDARQPDAHVRDRRFTDYVTSHFPQWRLAKHEANPHRADSRADFYVYEKA